MGYLDDIKDQKSSLHKELLGFDHPQDEIEAQKERLKAELGQTKLKKRGVIRMQNWVAIAAAASVLLFIGIKLASSNNTNQNQLTDEEMILIESLFVEEDQVDQFLDESLNEVFNDY